MKTTTMLRIAIASSALFVSTAHAQLFRAYLASDGNDGNSCTLQAPCRLLPAALNAVVSGGEIWMLDSANYNTATVNVNKSVSILAVPGVIGSVLAIGGPAISIAASGLTVALRNVVIAPLVGGGGTAGVSMTGASMLTIENSVIANLSSHGVYVAGAGTLKVAHTTLRNIGLSSNLSSAVWLMNGANATISGSHLLSNYFGGVYAYAGTGSTASTTANISDSVISGGAQGLFAHSITASGLARISVTRSMIERTGSALFSRTEGIGTAEINVGSSLIVNNDTAWRQEGTGSTILSLGNNQISGNGGSIGVLTPLAPQ